jgi:hypothetical protein
LGWCEGLVVNAQRASAVVDWLQRSSFSGLLGRSLLLLDVHGRRTGRHYRLPMQYAQAAPVIWVLPTGHERKRWRNLLQWQPVQLWLHEQQRRAALVEAAVLDSPGQP